MRMPRLHEANPDRELSLMVSSHEYMHIHPPLLDGVDVPDRIQRISQSRQNYYETFGSPAITIEEAEKDADCSPLNSDDELWGSQPTEGQLFWHHGESQFHFTDVLHIFPTQLSQAGIARVLANHRQYLQSLSERLRAQEQEYLATLPEIDRSKPVDLFEGVEVYHNGERVILRLPPRVIRTEPYGSLILNVWGREQTAKKWNHYGSERFSRSGDRYWFPHAFPCDDIDPLLHTPDILDRPRVEIKISLSNPYHLLNKDLPMAKILLATDKDLLQLLPDTDAIIGMQGWSRSLEYEQAMSERQANQQRVVEDEQTHKVPELFKGVVPRHIWMPVDVLESDTVNVRLYSDNLGIQH